MNFKKFHYPVIFEAGQIIGIFETIFNKRSQFIYKSFKNSASDSFFLRKSSWKTILKETTHLPVTIDNFKKIILGDYIDKIYLPI
mmetsp:Transcript_31133/g.47595  ORF Transcript_31133/g.47595 Transcript_31133/m.47595 type:complete len:85 (+) Transcript_31133:2123-2377(+)